MSKIGNKIIEIPEKTTVDLKEQEVLIKGANGELKIVLPKSLEIIKENNLLKIKRKSDDKKIKSLHGLYRQLIYNAILGVEKLWEKRLKLVGTGYQVKLENNNLIFKVGYSHPVVFKSKEGIILKVEGNDTVIVQGVDKQKVGEIAYQIKMIKKPDVYKGKGIRYQDEKLRIKPGKKAKTGAS